MCFQVKTSRKFKGDFPSLMCWKELKIRMDKNREVTITTPYMDYVCYKGSLELLYRQGTVELPMVRIGRAGGRIFSGYHSYTTPREFLSYKNLPFWLVDAVTVQLHVSARTRGTMWINRHGEIVSEGLMFHTVYLTNIVKYDKMLSLWELLVELDLELKTKEGQDV